MTLFGHCLRCQSLHHCDGSVQPMVLLSQWRDGCQHVALQEYKHNGHNHYAHYQSHCCWDPNHVAACYKAPCSYGNEEDWREEEHEIQCLSQGQCQGQGHCRSRFMVIWEWFYMCVQFMHFQVGYVEGARNEIGGAAKCMMLDSGSFSCLKPSFKHVCMSKEVNLCKRVCL